MTSLNGKNTNTKWIKEQKLEGTGKQKEAKGRVFYKIGLSRNVRYFPKHIKNMGSNGY